jgi:hypothetical protein
MDMLGLLWWHTKVKALFIHFVSHYVGFKVTPGNRLFKSGLNESRETFDVSKRISTVLNRYPLFHSTMDMLNSFQGKTMGIALLIHLVSH